MSKGPTAHAINVTIPSGGGGGNLLTINVPGALQDVSNLVAPANVFPNQTIVVDANILAGTGTTALVFTLKNSSGATVSAAQTDVAQTTTPDGYPLMFVDSSGIPTSFYVLSVVATGSTANGTANVINGYAQTDG